MALQAIIMAGGEGSRLRPLTCDTPKPLMPVLGRPVMAYTLMLLHRHGFDEVGVTLQYLPERITRAFGAGERYGVRLRYVREREPLGTAGGVLRACGGAKAPAQTFAVLSGDGLTDCDLSAALHFHREKRALATMVLSRVREPLAYGVVVADGDGRVRRFVEKPGWGEVYADTVNTGIYLLEPEVLQEINAEGPCDFGRDLFPRLVAQGRDVYGFVSDGYWCDIGDQSAYLRAQTDMLCGRVRLDAGAHVAETAQIDASAKLDGPCFVGAGAVIGAHACLSDGAVIGAGAVVGAHARVSRSVLWEEARVGDCAQVSGAVVCRGAMVGAGASMREESALGDGAVLGARAALETGAKVWPGKRIDPCVRVTENLVWEGVPRLRLEGGIAAVNCPQDVCRLAACWAEAADCAEMALGHDGSAEGAALCDAASGALCAQGVTPVLLGEATLPVLRCAQRLSGLQAVLYFAAGNATLCGALGALPTRERQRKAETLYARQDFRRPFAGQTARPRPFPDAQALYVGALTACVPPRAFAEVSPHVAVFAPTRWQAALAERALAAVGLTGRAAVGEGEVEAWEIGFRLQNDGETVEIFDSHGVPDEAEQTLLAYSALGGGGTWVAKLDAPAALDELAKEHRAALRRVSATREAWGGALLEAGTAQFDLQFDGLYRALRVTALLAAKRTTLRGVLAALPKVFRHTEKTPCPLPSRGRALRVLAEAEKDALLDGGLRITRPNGWATLDADSRAADITVCAEAANAETARELCDFYVGKLKQAVMRTEKDV